MKFQLHHDFMFCPRMNDTRRNHCRGRVLKMSMVRERQRGYSIERSMKAQMYVGTESPAEEAFHIAYDYLERAGAVSEELPVYVFLAREIRRLLDRGVKNRIKLANLAIGAFYAHFEINEQPI